MKDEQKTKKQFVEELAELRQRVKMSGDGDQPSPRARADHLHSILQAMDDFIFVLDQDNRFVSTYTPYGNLYLPPDEFLGKTHAEVMPAHVDKLFAAALPEVKQGETAGYEYHLEMPEGTCWYAMKLSALMDGEEYTGLVAVARDITEWVRAEQALRLSEEKLKNLMENVPIGIALSTPEEGVSEANPAIYKMFGYDTKDDFLKMPASAHYCDPKDRERFIVKLNKEGAVKDFEARFKRKNGTEFYGSVTSIIQIAETGAVQFINVFMDITKRKRVEDKLRRQADESDALHQTVMEITSHHELPVQLQTIVERATNLLDATSGGMYLCDSEKREARCVVSYNTPSDYTGTILKYGEGAAGTVAESGEILIIDDYRTWKKRAEVYEEEQPFRSVITVPMIWQDDVIGVILILHDLKRQIFTPLDLGLVTLFANHAAIAVANAQLREDIQRYANELEERVHDRTEDLNQIIIAMTGRETRMADLKKVITKLRAQLKEAGMTPVAFDPLLGPDQEW